MVEHVEYQLVGLVAFLGSVNRARHHLHAALGLGEQQPTNVVSVHSFSSLESFGLKWNVGAYRLVVFFFQLVKVVAYLSASQH